MSTLTVTFLAQLINFLKFQEKNYGKKIFFTKKTFSFGQKASSAKLECGNYASDVPAFSWIFFCTKYNPSTGAWIIKLSLLYSSTSWTTT